jgi:hypothetical protein
MKVSRNNLSSIQAASLALLATVTVSAQSAIAAKVLSGEVCSARVHALTANIDWKRNLKDAQKEAQSDGKLIVWVHMLGKIDGAT